jgi:NAD(P)H-quinone oxidoreductase subunit 5
MIPMASLEVLMLVGVGSPAALLALLGGASLVNWPLPERWTGRLAAGAMTISCAAFCAALLVYATIRMEAMVLYDAWSTSHAGGIAIEFLLDGMSLGFAALSAAIAGVVSAFSNRYLHREPGYNRYFFLLAMFVTGMLLVALAGNVEVLFAGWEFVGLSSALLVGFFHERPAPVSNALRVFSVYRISDAAMLSAAVLLHHVAGSGSLSLLFGAPTVASAALLTGTDATMIAVLLIVAVAGKSALLPFSGWLPRAMEGPTPSSAVYYGSLSIHAGCFLLLRAAPLLEQSTPARLLAGGIGVATALYSTLTTRVQSDVKSSLAYASLTQVGIIVVEIALGLYTIAFLHLAGHACFRLLQFLSAPNVLHDLHGLEAAVGERLASTGGYLQARVSEGARRRLFLFALERGFVDAVLDRLFVDPFFWLTRQMSRLDRFLCDVVIRRAPAILVEAVEDRDD